MRSLLPAHPGPCQSPQGAADNPGQVRLRENGSGWVGVKFSSSSLILYQSSGAVSLDTETITTDTDEWYEYYAVCDGANIEVWRRKKGATDAMTKILETTSTTQTAAGYLTFASGTGNYLADISLLELDGDVLKNEIFVYNAANELTSQTVGGTATNFAYDQFGRMTQKTRSGSTATYTYNYGDKLTKVASNFGGEGTVTYTYSGDQKRRSRAVSGGDTTKYRYDQGWSVLNEENGSGTLQATYVHSPMRQIGTVLATSAGSTASSGTWNYYFQDAIGSTRGLWDQDALRIGKYDYTPFGGKYSDSGEDITRKFTGHDWDADARLYYTAYRYYSPDANRWLTRDPLGMVDGPNVYAYVVNNPVSVWDALGQCGVSFESSIVQNTAREFLTDVLECMGMDDILNDLFVDMILIGLGIEVALFVTPVPKTDWGYSKKGNTNGISVLLHSMIKRGWIRDKPSFYKGRGNSKSGAKSLIGLGYIVAVVLAMKPFVDFTRFGDCTVHVLKQYANEK